MTEKDVRLEITKKISQGELKSSLYEQFKEEINDEALRKILASRPSYELWKKYKTVHLVLSIIWGFFILFEVFGILNLVISFEIKVLVSIILSLYVTVNIWKFDGRFFLPGIVWFLITIVRAFIELDTLYAYDSDYAVILVVVTVYSLILALGIYLMYEIRKNVFSYMKWFKPILNQEGDIQFE